MTKDLEVDFSDLLNVFDDIFGKEHMNNFREKFGTKKCCDDQCCSKPVTGETPAACQQEKKFNIFDEFRETLENKAKKKTFKRCEYETMLKALTMLQANYNSDGICQNIKEIIGTDESYVDSPVWNWEEYNYIISEDRKYKTVPLGPDDTDLIYPGLEIVKIFGKCIFRVKYVMEESVIIVKIYDFWNGVHEESVGEIFEYTYEDLLCNFILKDGSELGKKVAE